MLLENISKEQKEQIKTVVDEAGGIYKYAKQKRINRGHVSLAYNGKYLSPMMCELMGWGVSVTVPKSTLDGLRKDRDVLKEEIEILNAVIERLHSNQQPPGTLPTEPCPDCGNVHKVPWCVERDGEPQRPKPPAKRKRHQIRLAASLTKERRDALRELAAQDGKTWSEFCEELADRYIEDSEGLYF